MVDDAINDIRNAYNRLDEAYEAVLVVQEELDKAIAEKDGPKVELALKELDEWWAEIKYYEGEFSKDVNTLMKEVISEEHYYGTSNRDFVPIFRHR